MHNFLLKNARGQCMGCLVEDLLRADNKASWHHECMSARGTRAQHAHAHAHASTHTYNQEMGASWRPEPHSKEWSQPRLAGRPYEVDP